MTDDEKQAIEILRTIKRPTLATGFERQKDLLKAIETVLNLIEKQQEEIEHQKEKRNNQKEELAILNEKQKEFNDLTNTVKSYKGQFKRQQAELKKYKEMLAVSVADRVNSAFEQKYKNDEDLEMLYKGCQIEIENKDKIIDEMAKELAKLNYIQYCNEKNCSYPLCNKENCIKRYFKKKVEENE